MTATHDPALLQAGRLTIRSLVQLIARLREEIVRHEQKIEDVAQAHPDFSILDSLPGVGRALAPRLITALGTDRSRFQTAQQLQRYTGIAPVLASSGQQRWVHSRWACPKFVRQTIHEWAQHSIAGCPWAREYYQAQRSRGKSHHTAVRALAFKWLRILFRYWKDRQPYQEQIYQQALSRHAFSSPADPTASPPDGQPKAPPTPPSSNTPLSAPSPVQLGWNRVWDSSNLGLFPLTD